MRPEKKVVLLSTLLISMAVLPLACDKDDDDNNGIPAAPELKSTQIDRAGRPAVSTALVSSMVYANLNEKNAAKDLYNSTQGSSAASIAQMKTHLAVLDGLDTTCGNSLLADMGVSGGKTRYQFLAEVLSDDQLYLNAAGTECGFLDVEFNAVGQANTKCGGRMPSEDVIDILYSALATGNPAAGVTDGVSLNDSDKSHAFTEFPFLDAP